MSKQRRRRLARRRLKAHDTGASNRHNRAVEWMLKRSRLHNEYRSRNR